MLAILASCSAPKEVLYLQDIASLKEEVIDKNYEVIIHKDDLLAILVNSKDPELSDCLHCGHCDSRCPFHVQQSARMEEIAAYFGV